MHGLRFVSKLGKALQRCGEKIRQRYSLARLKALNAGSETPQTTPEIVSPTAEAVLKGSAHLSIAGRVSCCLQDENAVL